MQIFFAEVQLCIIHCYLSEALGCGQRVAVLCGHLCWAWRIQRVCAVASQGGVQGLRSDVAPTERLQTGRFLCWAQRDVWASLWWVCSWPCGKELVWKQHSGSCHEWWSKGRCTHVPHTTQQQQSDKVLRNFRMSELKAMPRNVALLWYSYRQCVETIGLVLFHAAPLKPITTQPQQSVWTKQSGRLCIAVWLRNARWISVCQNESIIQHVHYHFFFFLIKTITVVVLKSWRDEYEVVDQGWFALPNDGWLQNHWKKKEILRYGYVAEGAVNTW